MGLKPQRGSQDGRRAEAGSVLSCQTKRLDEGFTKVGNRTEHFAELVSSFAKENSLIPTSWGVVRTQ